MNDQPNCSRPDHLSIPLGSIAQVLEPIIGHSADLESHTQPPQPPKQAYYYVSQPLNKLDHIKLPFSLNDGAQNDERRDAVDQLGLSDKMNQWCGDGDDDASDLHEFENPQRMQNPNTPESHPLQVNDLQIQPLLLGNKSGNVRKRPTAAENSALSDVTSMDRFSVADSYGISSYCEIRSRSGSMDRLPDGLELQLHSSTTHFNNQLNQSLYLHTHAIPRSSTLDPLSTSNSSAPNNLSFFHSPPAPHHHRHPAPIAAALNHSGHFQAYPNLGQTPSIPQTELLLVPNTTHQPLQLTPLGQTTSLSHLHHHPQENNQQSEHPAAHGLFLPAPSSAFPHFNSQAQIPPAPGLISSKQRRSSTICDAKGSPQQHPLQFLTPTMDNSAADITTTSSLYSSDSTYALYATTTPHNNDHPPSCPSKPTVLSHYHPRQYDPTNQISNHTLANSISFDSGVKDYPTASTQTTQYPQQYPRQLSHLAIPSHPPSSQAAHASIPPQSQRTFEPRQPQPQPNLQPLLSMGKIAHESSHSRKSIVVPTPLQSMDEGPGEGGDQGGLNPLPGAADGHIVPVTESSTPKTCDRVASKLSPPSVILQRPTLPQTELILPLHSSILPQQDPPLLNPLPGLSAGPHSALQQHQLGITSHPPQPVQLRRPAVTPPLFPHHPDSNHPPVPNSSLTNDPIAAFVSNHPTLLQLFSANGIDISPSSTTPSSSSSSATATPHVKFSTAVPQQHNGSCEADRGVSSPPRSGRQSFNRQSFTTLATSSNNSTHSSSKINNTCTMMPSSTDPPHRSSRPPPVLSTSTLVQLGEPTSPPTAPILPQPYNLIINATLNVDSIHSHHHHYLDHHRTLDSPHSDHSSPTSNHSSVRMHTPTLHSSMTDNDHSQSLMHDVKDPPYQFRSTTSSSRISSHYDGMTAGDSVRPGNEPVDRHCFACSPNQQHRCPHPFLGGDSSRVSIASNMLSHRDSAQDSARVSTNSLLCHFQEFSVNTHPDSSSSAVPHQSTRPQSLTQRSMIPQVPPLIQDHPPMGFPSSYSPQPGMFANSSQSPPHLTVNRSSDHRQRPHPSLQPSTIAHSSHDSSTFRAPSTHHSSQYPTSFVSVQQQPQQQSHQQPHPATEIHLLSQIYSNDPHPTTAAAAMTATTRTSTHSSTELLPNHDAAATMHGPPLDTFVQSEFYYPHPVLHHPHPNQPSDHLSAQLPLQRHCQSSTRHRLPAQPHSVGSTTTITSSIPVSTSPSHNNHPHYAHLISLHSPPTMPSHASSRSARTSSTTITAIGDDTPSVVDDESQSQFDEQFNKAYAKRYRKRRQTNHTHNPNMDSHTNNNSPRQHSQPSNQ